MSEEELEAADLYRCMREESKERRKRNREHGVAMLRQARIPFTTRNGGAHIVIRHNGLIVDYWPGTGLYRRRKVGLRGSGTADGRGLQNLIQMLQQQGIKA